MAQKLVNAVTPTIKKSPTGKTVVLAYKTILDTGKDYRGKLGAKDRARKAKADGMRSVPKETPKT